MANYVRTDEGVRSTGTFVVEHVFNVLETLQNGHVENVPHIVLGLLSESSIL